MIKSIEINNYRGIEEIKIDKLRKYNIFVGTNGSFKTTVMEAIYSSLPNIYDGIITTANSRGLQVRIDNLHDFFYNANTNNEIRFVLNDEMETKLLVKNIPNINIIGTSKSDEHKVLYNILRKDINSEKLLDVDILIKDYSQQILLRANEIVDKFEWENEGVWVNFVEKYQSNVAKIVKKMIENKEKEKILEVVNILQSDIDDIISDGVDIKISKKNVEKLLSLSSLGKGVSSILSTMCNLFDGNKKILFIDEIEDGINYLNYPKFCEYLIKVAETLDIQLFITTRSIEFLEAFCNKMDKDDDSVSLYKFQKVKDKLKIKYVIY